MWHYSRYNPTLERSEGSGYETRKAALADAKKHTRNVGLPGFHYIYTYQTIEKNGITEVVKSTAKYNQFTLNPKKVILPEESLLELVKIARKKDDIEAEKRMFTLLLSKLFHSFVKHAYVRPILNFKKSHIIANETFSVGDMHWDKGDALCKGEYAGRKGICYNCIEEFAKYRHMVDVDRVRIRYKTRKSIMIIDDNEENSAIIRKMVKNEEVITITARSGVANARDKAAYLLPDLTLINITSPKALYLAEEMRRNNMNVIIYGDIKTQDAIKADPSLSMTKAMALFVPLPRTAEEMDAFSQLLIGEIRKDDNK